MRTSGKLLWRTAGLLSFLSFLLLATGFVLAMNPQQLAPATGTSPAESAKTPAPLPAEGVRKIVALGDSLTRGAGDANGQGYVGLVRQALEKKAGHSIMFTNLAINGQESTDLLKQMSEAQVKTLIADADLILFTIGGNDLFRQTGGLYTIEQEKVAAAIPRSASTRAASNPAGPAPTTATFLRTVACANAHSTSLPTIGLTRQDATLPSKI